MASVPDILAHVEECTDLDVIAITDHDLFEGAEQARELVAQRRYRFQVIMGMEVTTREGHLLALGIERPVRSLQRLDRTLAEIHAQGGIAIIPHPMSWLIRSVGQRGILRILADPSPEVFFDGIEALNSSFAGQVSGAKTRELNRGIFRLPETGGSDAHTLSMIGSGLTHFSGSSVQDLFTALRCGRTRSGGHYWNRKELKELARIAPRQSYRALVKLPGKHVRRALARRGALKIGAP
jgi:predicted metal-dependent phosphoesterase TrpH